MPNEPLRSDTGSARHHQFRPTLTQADYIYSTHWLAEQHHLIARSTSTGYSFYVCVAACSQVAAGYVDQLARATDPSRATVTGVKIVFS
jgi:hypothetical protein